MLAIGQSLCVGPVAKPAQVYVAGHAVLARPSSLDFGLWPCRHRGYTSPPHHLPGMPCPKGRSALFVSRWSIRRKLLVCLAIVLAIVAALAYSGFAGGYSYRELARTIGVRATDLKFSGELRESLGELRVSLSQTWELGQREFADEMPGVT